MRCACCGRSMAVEVRMRRTVLLVAVAVAALAVVAGAVSAFLASGSSGQGGASSSGTTRPAGSELSWVLDGTVKALAVADGKLFVGGEFNKVAAATGPLVGFTRGGVRDPSFPAADVGGAVHVAVSDGAGGLYVGGSFKTLGGVACAGLAHVRRGGVVDPAFCPRPNGPVGALALSGGRLFVGGDFSRVGGVTRNGLAVLDVKTGRATGWVSSLGADTGGVGQITPTPTAVWVEERGDLVALDPKTGRRLPFDPNIVSSPHGDGVEGFAVSGERVYAWGLFDRIGGKQLWGVAVLDARTGKALPWTGPRAMWGTTGLLNGSVLYLAGDFTSVGGQPRGGVAAFDAPTGRLLPWKPTGPSLAATGPLDVWDGVLYGTTLQTVFGRSLRTGAPVPIPLPRFNGSIDAIAHTANRLVVGGDFRSLAGNSYPNLLAIDAASGRVLPWKSGIPDAAVDELSAVGSTVYVAGSFSQAGGQARNDSAAFDAHTGELLPWQPGVDYVSGFAASSKGVYTGIPGEETLYQLDPQSGALRQTVSITEYIGALAASDEVIFDANWPDDSLLALQPAPLRVVARLVVPVNEAPYSLALAAEGRSVYLGGTYKRLAGGNQPYLARLRLDNNVLRIDPWRPRVPGPVYAVALAGNSVVVGGATADDRRFYIALVNRASGKTTVVGYWPASDDLWFAVAASGTSVYAGGDFGLRRFSAPTP
jgi:hypothetical protein